ncbi:sugar phosphate isomerase/epimerase [Ginsengibacter hankyongi]|uniref:Sugar phosphate isomerase/epimerase n=1 Tax=Ginsengibacter hankyongi TaxID=2607284 RepID=A0A5J5IJC2_9BACT|nr:sugar phosphate isomerase/epimerase [Ginsengibacter hankyongi]KAA9039099.1 sugar phosphate isomerase/epimerase [Ginsengibacter hankyongi]
MKKIAFLFLGCICIIALTKCNSTTTKTDTTNDSTSVAISDSGNVTANWKLGVQMWTFRMFPFADALDKVDSAGIKYIEAFWGQPLGAGMKDSFGIRMSDESKAKLKQLLQQKGISIVAMGVIVPNTRDEWKKAFDLAKEFGLSYITAEPHKDQWDMVDSMAGAYGIKVAIHDHPKPNVYWSPDSVLAATVGHPNIGSCADIGHWARNGVNPVDALKKLEGHIFGVHLKDIKKFDDTKSEDTVVGKGVIDFAPIFQELKRQHFSGMFSIEHESNWYHSVPDVIETVKFYNDQLSKLK